MQMRLCIITKLIVASATIAAVAVLMAASAAASFDNPEQEDRSSTPVIPDYSNLPLHQEAVYKRGIELPGNIHCCVNGIAGCCRRKRRIRRRRSFDDQLEFDANKLP
ncbi:hypothetical protein BOX15_Mlig010892g2 [Macrostomum lignano]|uniref:Uncharacterized protein n=2 Tax=Macrostomum lignano TaxID=282301 RepID=A0A267DLP6_9PLAT|nr:hypothetical protein BOX15_Mlig010892g2 [Macrostomum lignano]